MNEETILLRLRNAAKFCRDEKHREKIKYLADTIQVQIDMLKRDPIDINLALLNGYWAHALRTLKQTGNNEDDGGGGAMRPCELLAA